MISLNTVVKATTDQVSCDLDDEVVILALEDGVYYGLDPVGARIWALIQEQRVVKEIRDILVQEYDVAAEQCEADVLTFLESLQGWGLLTVDSPTNSTLVGDAKTG